MSVSKPQNRAEFKQHILTKLGHPVLEVNVSDEQLDIAIDDSFQYFNERNHFYGVERIYLSIRLSGDTLTNFTSFGADITDYDTVGNPVAPGPTGNVVRRQRNFIILPDDIIGVEEVLRGRGGLGGLGGGVVPPGIMFPGLIGNITGNSCDNNGFGLTQYYAAMEYLALVQFLLYPPKMYNFNQRTHRLHIDGDLNDLGGMLMLQCIAKPNPDIFPDLWDDLWLKMYATALVQLQWGRNLTKFNQVQLPGGITLNGDRILSDAQTEIQRIKDRFSLDWMDPPLDAVG